MLELLRRPVTELASLVREGGVTSTELVDAALARIEALDPELNAFCLVDAEGTRAAAAAIEPGDPRPFAGVPIAVKDGAAVNGQPLGAGSALLDGFTPRHDSHVVRRLKHAGFVIVGRTTMPEFGILPVTEPRRDGPCRNPWDLGRSPGGSSGGAAAAVAAGMVPLAHGSDGGGSIRIPAACCGLVGLKPARGRVSRGPECGDDLLVQDGVLTRTVGDTAALLDVLAGYEPGDATWAPPPAEPFASAARREPGSLRVALTLTPPIDAELDPGAEHAVREAAELLASLGHEVSEIEAPWAGRNLLGTFTVVFASGVAESIELAGMAAGREPSPALLEPLSWEIYSFAKARGALDYPLARRRLEAATRAIVGAIWAEHDVVLLPALAEPPVPIGAIDGCAERPWEDFSRSGRFTPFTSIFNVTGQPAISLPLFEQEGGLPLAVQLAGPPAGEELLLSLAAQLEAARPWHARRPPAPAAPEPLRP
ncbi:MAG: amidase [Nocardioidaceae bacterium]